MIDSELMVVVETRGCLAALRAYRLAEFDARQADSLATPGEPEVADDDTADAVIPSDAEPENEESPEDERRSRRKTPWLPRLVSLQGIAATELSRIHGLLIAYGLLKCELGDRSTGVVYQLTVSAKQLLNHTADSVEQAAA